MPSLGPLYERLYSGAETFLRVVAGALLVSHGYSKILDPFGASGLVESIGFYPGGFWSALLSVSEFLGGICLALGLFTRFAAFVTTIILAVTIYFHGILQGQGLGGAEKSILWAAITVFFVVRGANRHSLDSAIGRQI
ncbi:DoxX family protein [Ensifer canadensis]